MPSILSTLSGGRVKPGSSDLPGLDRTCCPHPLGTLSREGRRERVQLQKWLLGEEAGSTLGLEPAQCKNSLGQGKEEGVQSLEMELQCAARRVWEELEGQAGLPYGAPVPGGQPRKRPHSRGRAKGHMGVA